MQQRGDDGLLIKFQVSHQASDFDRMAEIGITAGALLAAMLLHGVDIRAVERRFIGVRVIIQDPFNKFVLA